ncbi:pyocin knob domain-containing protein [Clostridium malenominatum]
MSELAQIKTGTSTLLANRIEITTGTDLNNLKTEGNYCSKMHAITSTLLNCPVNAGQFNLEIQNAGNYTGRIIQMLTHYTSRAVMYVRTFTDVGWSPWRKMLNQDDYDQLFQYANDGKTSIANVVGGVTEYNTHQDIAIHIQWSKDVLAYHLINKDVSAVRAERLQDLVAKVEQIKTGKFATGSLTLTNPTSNSVVTVSDIGFTPDTIMLWIDNNSSYPYFATYTTHNRYTNPSIYVPISYNYGQAKGANSNFIVTVGEGTFTFKYPGEIYASNPVIKWVALRRG